MGQQVIQILKQAFPGMDVELDKELSGRLHGTVIWEGFDDQEMGDRQDTIRGALREALGERFSQVGILLTYTPREMSAMKAA